MPYGGFYSERNEERLGGFFPWLPSRFSLYIWFNQFECLSVFYFSCWCYCCGFFFILLKFMTCLSLLLEKFPLLFLQTFLLPFLLFFFCLCGTWHLCCTTHKPVIVSHLSLGESVFPWILGYIIALWPQLWWIQEKLEFSSLFTFYYCCGGSNLLPTLNSLGGFFEWRQDII